MNISVNHGPTGDEREDPPPIWAETHECDLGYLGLSVFLKYTVKNKRRISEKIRKSLFSRFYKVEEYFHNRKSVFSGGVACLLYQC